MSVTAIVLAAGEGTRMKSSRPKVVHEVLGRPMVRWVVEAAREAGATRLLGVRVSIGEATEAVEDALVFAFEALAEADPFTQGATLDLTMICPRSVCLECGHEFEHDLYNRFCPVCDSFATELLAGRELQIDSIEVDLPEE